MLGVAYSQHNSAGGVVKSIGGSRKAKVSKDVMQVEGPDGQLSILCPYVINSSFTLWGGDLMSQWGARVEIPAKQQDF